jgi:ribosome-associated protein
MEERSARVERTARGILDGMEASIDHHDGAVPPVLLPNGKGVPEYALLERATGSGGPGGQHANRTASSVELRVVVEALPLAAHERTIFMERVGRRLRADGTIGVRASDNRSQLANRKLARKRLTELLARLLHEETRRIPTREPVRVKRQAAETKRRTSARKSLRRPPELDE